LARASRGGGKNFGHGKASGKFTGGSNPHMGASRSQSGRKARSFKIYPSAPKIWPSGKGKGKRR